MPDRGFFIGRHKLPGTPHPLKYFSSSTDTHVCNTDRIQAWMNPPSVTFKTPSAMKSFA
jgi:hypothetical protein